MDSQRILVVDDDSLNRFLLMHMLEEQGYKDCFEASTGEEALELVKRVNPDLILLDIVMPGMNGFEVAKRLKQDQEGYLPIIFITASDDRDNLVKCLEVGGDDFAIKPFDKSILTAKIRAHLRIRGLSQHIEAQNAELSKYRLDVDREHAMVEHIYQHALKNPPEVEPFFDLMQTPASTFDGDLFLAQPHPNGGIYFLVGDFTGHGLASTIGAIPVSRTFSQMTAAGQSVVEISTSLNKLLYNMLPIDRFFSAAIVHVNADGSRATLWQGGIPDAFVQRTFNKSVSSLPAKHMALGILSPSEFESDCTLVELEPGDALFLFSDGITEATPVNPDSPEPSCQMLGEEAIKSWIEKNPDITTEQIMGKACEELSRLQYDDDVTLVKFVATDLTSLKAEETVSQLPFSFSVSLGPEELQKDDCVEQILQVFSSQPGMSAVRSDLFTVLSELYTNALEHGLLKLDSGMKESPDGFMQYYILKEQRLVNLDAGFIQIEINLYPHKKRIAIAVTDSGTGFDYKNKTERGDNASCGRGIQLLSEICDNLWFEGKGNRVVVELTA